MEVTCSSVAAGTTLLRAAPEMMSYADRGVSHRTLPPGPDDNDTLNGGGGRDLVDFGGAPSAIIANLVEGTATGEGFDTLTGVDDLIGTRFGDTLTGNGASNFIHEGQESNESLTKFFFWTVSKLEKLPEKRRRS